MPKHIEQEESIQPLLEQPDDTEDDHSVSFKEEVQFISPHLKSTTSSREAGKSLFAMLYMAQSSLLL